MNYRPSTDRLLKGFQYVVCIAFLWWIGQSTDWSRIGEILIDIDPAVIAGIGVASVVGLAFRFYTWYVLVTDLTPSSLSAAAAIDLTVNFINQLLPSRLSGRSAAPAVVRYHTGLDWSDAVAVSGAHTGLYGVLYGIVSSVGLLIALSRLPVGIAGVVFLSTMLYFLAGMVILVAGTRLELLDRLVKEVETLVRKLPRGGEYLAAAIPTAPEFTANSAATFRSLLSNRRIIRDYTVGWFVVMVLAPGVRVGLLLVAFGSAFEPLVLLPLYLVAAYSVTLLPLTPGGIGVTEATAALIFTSLGVPHDVIVPAILIDRFVGVYLPAIVGWYPTFKLDLADVLPD